MAESYKIVYEGGQAEIEEKKSKFIAYVKPVNSEEEACQFIDEIKKMNWNATHNCVAAVVGKNNEYSRCNDDGEPSGTAGKPMLEVLLGEGIHNVAVVVTRYFGGTLLGTGGLVRAYQKAVKEGLAISRIIEKMQGARAKINTDYTGIGKIQYITAQMNITVLNTDYSDVVEVEVMIPEDDIKNFEEKVTHSTSGRAIINIIEKVNYGIVDGKCIIMK